MTQQIHKLFILAGLWIAIAPALADDPPAASPAVPDEKPVEFLPPLPFEGGEERFAWWIHGAEIGSTRITVDPVRETDVPRTIRVRASFAFDAMGRIVTGDTEATYRGDIGHPVRYRHTLGVSAASLGSSEAILAATFEDGEARIERRDESERMIRTTVEAPPPTWLLDDQCFEHWVLLAPYFERILADGVLEVFVPQSGSTVTYRLKKERVEGEGSTARTRWALTGPAVEAKIWVDPTGRLVEYAQGELQIVRVPPREEEATTEPEGGDADEKDAAEDGPDGESKGGKPEGGKPAGGSGGGSCPIRDR